MSQLKCSSTWWSPRRYSATQSLVDPTAPQNSRAVTMLRYRNHRALSAANAKTESRWSALQPQRLMCNGAGLIALAFLSMAALRAAPLLHSASVLTSAAASRHQYEYCRFLTNGFVRVCEFDTFEQCKATTSRCERYPFLKYCQFAPNGQIQRCDFDTLTECQTASSGLADDCKRSPWLTTPEAPMPINQKSTRIRKERG
jgi:hypothetical protein